MEPGRWKDVSRLYHEARRRSPDLRPAFLERACADDTALRAEVESLLASDADAGTFLATPAAVLLDERAEVEVTLLVGRRVGPYVIDALVGVGGMGDVYRATDTRLRRTVALKFLPSHVREVPHLRERFDREARAVAALQHPHICVLHDIGEDSGLEFLVMEYLEGETLAERLTRGPLDRDELFRHAIEIVDALAETHRRGIVHGDLKPGNVMLAAGGAKLLDFGLARLIPGVAVIDSTGAGRDAPTPAVIAGTLSYMAPEQLVGRVADTRSDAFAFGAVLYEMMTATKAFPGRDVQRMGATAQADDPPVLPPDAAVWASGLAPFIARCLAHDPDARWARTFDMADELRRLSIASPDLGPAATPWIRSHPAWWGGALAASALVAAAWWTATGPAGSPLPALTLGNMQQLDAEDRLEIDPSFSPDGKMMAYAGGTAAQMRIFVRPVGEGSARPLTDEPDALQFHPRWSPDGRHILYVTPGGAFVVDADGGGARQVDSQADAAGSYSATTSSTGRRIFSSAIWSPDGQQLAIAYGGALSIVPFEGPGERRTVGSSPYELHSCDWSPDGHWIACVSGNWNYPGPSGYFGNISPSAIVLLPTGGGPPVEIMSRSAVHRSPAWSSDGRRLYFVSNRQGTSDIYSVELTDAGRVHGEPVRATTGLGVYSLTFSGDRRRMAYAVYTSRANVWSLPIPAEGATDVAGARPMTIGNQTIEAMRVSRDGRWLLYDSNLHGDFDIFRVAINGGRPERLTMDRSDEFAPDLSSDGQVLAYHSWQTGSRDIFVRRLDSAAAEQVTDTPSQESFPAWSPDGQAIAFLDQLVERGEARGAFLVRRDSTGQWSPPVLLRTGTSRVSWSPDGQFVAYARRGAVEVLPLDSRVPRVVYASAPASADPAAGAVQVSPDGRTLYLKSHDAHGNASLWSVPVSGGRPVPLARLDDPARPSSRTEFAVGHGQFYFAVESRQSNIWVADVTER